MNETFTLAHLSDLHLSSLNDVKVRELLNKRIYGYLKWQLKRRAEHRREVLDALLLNLQHTTPDQAPSERQLDPQNPFFIFHKLVT